MSCCNRTVVDREKIRRLFAEGLPQANRSLPRMADIVDNWLDINWPIYCEGDTVAFHAPVGNASYFNSESPARIIISGFCVAGEAGLKYVRSSLLSKNNKQNCEAVHTFDTPTMIRGMIKIIEHYCLFEIFGLNNAMDTFERAKVGEIPLMLTQALCPIIVGGSSKASDVCRALRNNHKLRCFIKDSLNRWWRLINDCSNRETIVMLMGNRMQGRGRAELIKLLAFSKLASDNVEITGTNQEPDSVLDELKKRFNGRVFFIKHAAWYGRN